MFAGEALEHRTLLATFVVVNTLDAGAGSLRQAMTDAHARAGVSQSNLPGAADVAATGDDFSRTEWYVNGEWVF